MPMSSKFPAESTGEKIVKIGQYLAKIWTKYDSLVFLGHPVEVEAHYIFHPSTIWVRPLFTELGPKKPHFAIKANEYMSP